MRPHLPAALLLLTACDVTVVEAYDDCVIALDVPLAPTRAGEAVTIGATPATATWDTTVRVGGLDATVLSVDRLDEAACVACDSCRADAGCLACGTCEACDELAACNSCTETVSFEVPALPSGSWPIVVFNLHGGSSDAPLITILPDTGLVDSDSDDPTADTDTDTDTPADSDTDADTDTDGVDSDSDTPHTDTDAP